MSNLTTINLTELCREAEYLVDSKQLHGMLIVRVIAASIGLLLFTILHRIQGIYLALHKNLLFLLLAHHVWVVLQCIGFIILYLFVLIGHSIVRDDPCEYLISSGLSFALRGPVTLCLYGQVLTLTAMAIERLVATVAYKTYELWTSVLGKVLCLIQWICALLLSFISIIPMDWSEMKVYPALASSRTSSILALNLQTLAGLELATIFVFIGILIYNKRKKNKMLMASLTEKYQVDENIRGLLIMLPMIVTHFCFFMPQLVMQAIYITLTYNSTVHPSDYTIFLETYSINQFYGVILPVILFWRHKALRRYLKSVLKLDNAVTDRATNNSNERIQEQNLHFSMLRHVWAGP